MELVSPQRSLVDFHKKAESIDPRVAHLSSYFNGLVTDYCFGRGSSLTRDRNLARQGSFCYGKATIH